MAKAVDLHAQTALVPPLRSIDTLGLAAAMPFAETITAAELRTTAFIFASDSLQGRETGTDGQRRAARFLSGQVAALGLPTLPATGNYEQPIALASATWDTTGFTVNGKEFKLMKDFYAFPAESRDLSLATDEVVYIGYGINDPTYNDYDFSGDLRGKVAVVLAGEPFREDGTSLVTGTRDTSEWSAGDSRKRAAAEEAGLSALLIVEPAIQRALVANTVAPHRTRSADDRPGRAGQRRAGRGDRRHRSRLTEDLRRVDRRQAA